MDAFILSPKRGENQPTLMSEKQVLNDILQGSGGLLITKLKRFIAECVSEKNIFKSVNIWQS